MNTARFDVVVPTVGRESLATLLAALDAGDGPLPGRVLLVDDRRSPGAPLPIPPLRRLDGRVEVLRGRAQGPAAARNTGWRAASAPWIAFLDDDTVPTQSWLDDLAGDLAGLPHTVVASQGRIVVPLPADRRPTDWERSVHGLERARWATADMAYRRRSLQALGGFDERFPRAYREDADLGLRVVRAGGEIRAGARAVLHPVRPADRWVSVRLQRGNADDPLMRALHGSAWRRDAGVPRGRRGRHMAIMASAGAALLAAAARRPRLAAAAGLAWLAGTAELAAARILPGPCTRDEVTTMLVTSAAIPPAATWHWLRGRLAAERALQDTRRAPRSGFPRAVLFDRDGTLVSDVPYNGDPGRVAPVPGARAAVERLRRAGVRVGVVSNQSGMARGLLTAAQVAAVNRRVDALLGPFDTWQVCPHGPDDACDCRKPRPGMVLRAAQSLGVDPSDCAVIGDVGADVEAAAAAGGLGVLVPNRATREAEVREAPLVAPDLAAAVDLLLGDVP